MSKPMDLLEHVPSGFSFPEENSPLEGLAL